MSEVLLRSTSSHEVEVWSGCNGYWSSGVFLGVVSVSAIGDSGRE